MSVECDVVDLDVVVDVVVDETVVVDAEFS